MSTERCPCLSGNPYDECCGPLHAGAPAPTAERLMRSRFSAFALGLPAYLLDSWHPSTRPATLELDPAQRWTRLDIVAARSGGPFDTAGTVTFRAWWRTDISRGTLEETSEFVREAGRWYYVDGIVA
ncbi:YchJ family metal-binding protein [Curtobacterium sp. MCSS17_015]|uniref:YchJ family protein n=1 Tax=Curtobacterium sp. MCSS17_015 TaxID=2175666 RepID=UPI000DA73927|nr:YchJ family metal-binding protein [Curtobacterium sp. MCSS17_015]WIB27044.1 YchJ family metal-binding protein [Curtobacterium sp. MCSS17_015]